MTDRYYTASTTFLQALAEAGARYIFANFGSDHTGIIEAMAQARAQRQAGQLPRLIVCPHETAAFSAAHAYAMVRGQPQAVTVQVDATFELLSIFAGSAPSTQEGELPGGRNEVIQWIQDVRDQRGRHRNYVKFDSELRSGRNVKQIVHQALQIARSELAGLVYLTAPREVMEEQLRSYVVDLAEHSPIAPVGLAADVTAEVTTALAGAWNPRVVTSYLGLPRPGYRGCSCAGTAALP
jgi:acetolactate synthase-1/2/3 large subunit